MVVPERCPAHRIFTLSAGPVTQNLSRNGHVPWSQAQDLVRDLKFAEPGDRIPPQKK
jgi:hypothetical protein